MQARTRAILLFGMAFVIILLVFASDYRQSQYLIHSFNAVEQSQQTITLIHKVASQLKDVQRSHRGYVLTQKPEFLTPYEHASHDISKSLSQLYEQVRTDEQRQLLDSLRQQIAKKIAYVEDAIVQVNSGDIEVAIEGIPAGKRLMDLILAELTRLENNEYLKTKQYQADVREHDRLNRIVIITGLIASSSITFIALYLILSHQARIESLKKELEESNKELTQANEEFKSTNESLSQSEQKLRTAKDKLLYREKQLLQAQHIAKTGSIDWNVRTDIIEYTEEFARIMRIPSARRYSFRELMHKIHPDDQQMIHDSIRAAVEQKVEWVKEFRLQFDDDVTHVLVSAEPVFKEQKFHGYLGTVTDVTEQRKAQEELRISEKKFRAVIDAAPDPMIICTVDGVISIVNRETEKLFQYTKEELVGKKLEYLLPFRYRFDVIELRGTSLQNHRLGEDTLHLNLTGLKKDGTEIPIEINFSPIRDANPALIAAAIRDVTTSREAEQKMIEANQQLAKGNEALQKANQELSSFSYSISHDLRAPLRAINGYSGILHEDYHDKLDARGLRALKTIQDNACRMDQLINDLLELARLGYTAIHRQQVDMRSVIDAVLSTKPSEQKRGISVQPMGACFADPSLLRQVWENLISNAIKFTDKKETRKIEIGYQSRVTDQVFFIKDNGVGFDPDYTDKLFKVFSRLHAKTEFEGTGAGLAIVKKIIETHGGTVWAESKPGEGATFFFTLPLAAPKQHQA